jgi:hypothetical protein
MVWVLIVAMLAAGLGYLKVRRQRKTSTAH